MCADVSLTNVLFPLQGKENIVYAGQEKGKQNLQEGKKERNIADITLTNGTIHILVPQKQYLIFLGLPNQGQRPLVLSDRALDCVICY